MRGRAASSQAHDLVAREQGTHRDGQELRVEARRDADIGQIELADVLGGSRGA